MRIAVLGGGNGSYAAAADLSEQGHEVRFWRRDAAAFRETLEAQAIELKDFQGRRPIPLALATTDLGSAVADAALIVIPTPAFAQEDIARALAPHLRDGQVLFLPPGTFGSYVMTRALRDGGCRVRVSIAETGTLPWLTRKHGPNLVAITTRASRLPTGVFPGKRSASALEVIRAAFPSVEACGDGLSGALMNAGPIIHPPLIVMNAGPIEHFDKWDIHREGTQPSIRRVTDVLDAERMAATGRRTTRCATTTPATGGCTATSRTTSWWTAATGRRSSILPAIVTCARTSATAWPSWFRCASGRACRARSRAGCSPSALR
jgi:opine dehydrogenase